MRGNCLLAGHEIAGRPPSRHRLPFLHPKWVVTWHNAERESGGDVRCGGKYLGFGMPKETLQGLVDGSIGGQWSNVDDSASSTGAIRRSLWAAAQALCAGWVDGKSDFNRAVGPRRWLKGGLAKWAASARPGHQVRQNLSTNPLLNAADKVSCFLWWGRGW